jgi:DNA polymerase II large subunit
MKDTVHDFESIREQIERLKKERELADKQLEIEQALREIHEKKPAEELIAHPFLRDPRAKIGPVSTKMRWVLTGTDGWKFEKFAVP